jgi:hypothetical protein
MVAIPFAVFEMEYLCLERVSLNAVVQFGHEISGENVPYPSGTSVPEWVEGQDEG